ncbi:acyl-CoA (8-3)-desaturase-like [Amphiura filiformis]|uniref:acyl-CoA (8-3)-desaturase-like n=1 Tax=Amphiura filiformis TaxID=82378 RepID=UPI003B21A667
MGKGGDQQERVPSGGVGQGLSWEEIGQRDGKAGRDKWLVIDGQVYNITRWSKKHPGGHKVISHYAGQDASEAFLAFHNNQKEVRKYLKAFHVGHVIPSEWKEKEIVKDMKELRLTVEKMGLFKPSVFFFAFQIFQIIGFDVLAYLNLYFYGVSFSTFSLSAFLLGMSQTLAGWTQHDFGHLSISKKTWVNQILHYFTMGTLKGASSRWWNHMHYQHHAKPNVINKDPDVRLELLFVVGKKMPKTIAESGKSTMPYNWQDKYFPILGPPLLFPLYFQWMLFYYIFTRKQWLDLAFCLSFYVKFFILYIPILGIWKTLVLMEIMRVIESIWFTWVSQSNHIPMEIDEDTAKPWLELQLRATCNLEKNMFNDWFTGHLNFQVEHHLFPTMPRHNLHRAQPLVKSLCAKHGIDYKVKTLYGGFKDILGSLHESGKIWFDAYYHLKDDL